MDQYVQEQEVKRRLEMDEDTVSQQVSIVSAHVSVSQEEEDRMMKLMNGETK